MEKPKTENECLKQLKENHVEFSRLYLGHHSGCKICLVLVEVERLQKEVERHGGHGLCRVNTLEAKVERLKTENEKLQAQLAGCSVAALGGTDTVVKQGDYGWSASYQDVLELRLKYEQLRKALEPCL